MIAVLRSEGFPSRGDPTATARFLPPRNILLANCPGFVRPEVPPADGIGRHGDDRPLTQIHPMANIDGRQQRPRLLDRILGASPSNSVFTPDRRRRVPEADMPSSSRSKESWVAGVS